MNSREPDLAAETKSQPKRISRSCLVLIAILAILLTVAVAAFLKIGFEIKKGVDSWGKPQISLGQNAKKVIEENTPLRPSASASNFYYFITGFQDHMDFASYTDKPERISEIVKALTGKDIDELDFFDRNKEPDVWIRGAHGEIYEPGDIDSEYRTSFYDVNAIKNGRCFYSINREKNDYWMLIVDTEKSRIFYMSWDT